MPQVVNVQDVLDRSPFGSFQQSLVALCLASLILDGFDAQAIGYIAPELVREWGVSRADLGPIFGAGQIGTLIGALLCTVLADRFGRRPLMIAGTAAFGLLSLLTAMTRSPGELMVVRLAAGIALGGLTPIAMALAAEYSGRQRRVMLMMTIGVGFTVGAAVVGGVSAFIIPTLGWRWVFYIGGVLPLLVATGMFFWLPESIPFLIVRGRRLEKIHSWLKRIDPEMRTSGDTEFTVAEENKSGATVRHLFTSGRTPGTLLLWVIQFMNLLNLFFLSNWLPTIVTQAGYSISTAAVVGTTLQCGGILGTFGLAWLIGRYGFSRILGVNFVVAACAVALIGRPGLTLAPLLVVAFVTGWCIVGGQPGVNTMAGTYYPTYLRSTGIGWALGLGRFGGIVGPVLAGEMIRRSWPISQIFIAAAIPALVSAASIPLIARMMRREQSRQPEVRVAEAYSPIR